MLIWTGHLLDEEETALMEMSDLKCLQTIRTRQAFTFKYTYLKSVLKSKLRFIAGIPVMSLQIMFEFAKVCFVSIFHIFTTVASVASWLWLLNISGHVSCQFGSIYHGSKLEQGGGRKQIASSKNVSIVFWTGRGIKVHKKV